MTDRLTLIALDGVPLIEPGDDLAAVIAGALEASGERLAAGDVLVLAQKIVSKAEGRIVELSGVTPGAEAQALAAKTEKDPRLVELILRDSRAVVRTRPGLLIVEHRLGLVLANAGIDASNVAADDETVLLLPQDPDATCRGLRAALHARYRLDIGVVIADSIGRAWRLGTIGTAIGAAGVPALADLRGEADLLGRPLRVSEQAYADELAAAASLVQGQAAEGRPIVLVRGFDRSAPERDAAALLRPSAEDLFR